MAKKAQKIILVFIINGQETSIEANLNSPLKSAVERALAKSGNTGRPADEWEVRNVGGVLLDKTLKIDELNLDDNARLFLSLRVGAGGNG